MQQRESRDEILAFLKSNLKEWPEFTAKLDERKDPLLGDIGKDQDATAVQFPSIGFWSDLDHYFKTDPGWTSCSIGDGALQSKALLGNLARAFDAINAQLEFENLLSGMNNPSFDLFIGAIAPECLNVKNRQAVEPSDFECLSVDFPETDAPAKRDAKGAITNMAALRTRARNRILWSLQDQTKPAPVVLSVCSAFLKDSTVKTNFNEWWACEKAGGGSHAVTVIGARKNPAGKCEYLIQNSWGADCTQYGARKCEKGKLWIEEDEVIMNTRRIEKMVKKKAPASGTLKK